MKMTTSLLGFFTLLGMTSAWADQPKVDITSFVYGGPRTQAAEVCGKVSGAPSKSPTVEVIVDEKSDHPGYYYSLAGKEGRFCLAVITWDGTASATLWNAATQRTLTTPVRVTATEIK